MLSYCANEVHRYDRDAFIASLFVPAGEREDLLAIYALNLELAHIPQIVSEEMIGHIRLAWWQEAVAELYLGKEPRGQPVLQALAPVIQSGRLPQEVLQPLLDAWRESYPDAPPELDKIFASLAEFLIADPTGWRKANAIIEKHRKRYEKRLNAWLSLKLLVAGF